MRRTWIILGLVLMVGIGVLGWKTYRFWNRPLTPQVAEAAPPVAKDKFTVMIMGADDRPGAPGRSDTLMLGFVDLNAGSIKLLSVPRDTWAQIPGHGWDKINAAYAYGGEAATEQAVQQLTGMPVDYVVAVNMQGFQQIVDAVGGVDIQVDEDMNYDDPSDDPPLHIHLQAGLQHMNGEDALHYVRFRHDSQSDWGRMKRQQDFLKALMVAAKKPSNLARLPQLLGLVTKNVRTNLSPSQLTQIAMLAKDKLNAQSMSTGQELSGDDLWTPEGYYLALHFQEMRDTIHQLAGVEPDAAMQAQDAKDAAEYQASLPVGTNNPSAWIDGAVPGEPAGKAADSASAAVTGPATPTAPAQSGEKGQQAPGTETKGSGQSATGTVSQVKPPGTESQPSGTETKPSGTETQPSGTGPQTSGSETQPSGTKTQPSGTETQTSGSGTQTSGTKTQTSGTGTQSH